MQIDSSVNYTSVESTSIQEVESKLGIKFKIRQKMTSAVKPDDLFVDMSYQRETNLIKVNEIMRAFNKNAIGVVILSIRENGDLFIIDGAHRVEALKKLGLGGSDLNAIVYFDLTVEDEAALFVLFNNVRTKPKRADLHKASVRAGDKSYTEIDQMLYSHGFMIAKKPGNNIIRAVASLYSIYNKSGLLGLERVILVLKGAYGVHSSGFQSELMSAVNMIIAANPLIENDKLSRAIMRSGSPDLLLAKVNGMISSSRNISKVIVLANIFIGNYNHKLRINRLDEFSIGKV